MKVSRILHYEQCGCGARAGYLTTNAENKGEYHKCPPCTKAYIQNHSCNYNSSLIVSGTGHRPDKLGGYTQSSQRRLVSIAKTALAQLKPAKVVSGMALGWDQALALAALELNIPFVAAVPFDGFDAKWPTLSREQYRTLLFCACEVVYVSEPPYAAHKLQIRNQYLVDNCTLLLAMWNGSRGGTFNCLQYASKQQRRTVNLYDLWKQQAQV